MKPFCFGGIESERMTAVRSSSDMKLAVEVENRWSAESCSTRRASWRRMLRRHPSEHSLQSFVSELIELRVCVHGEVDCRLTHPLYTLATVVEDITYEVRTRQLTSLLFLL